mmetsp:Transcript_1945/g.6216  ORF Transcript_1945/g.6216 Transcript_1945/m.6216 type:complete len:210 (-) Transcript_1945:280-909(-)
MLSIIFFHFSTFSSVIRYLSSNSLSRSVNTRSKYVHTLVAASLHNATHSNTSVSVIFPRIFVPSSIVLSSVSSLIKNAHVIVAFAFISSSLVGSSASANVGVSPSPFPLLISIKHAVELHIHPFVSTPDKINANPTAFNAQERKLPSFFSSCTLTMRPNEAFFSNSIAAFAQDFTNCSVVLSFSFSSFKGSSKDDPSSSSSFFEGSNLQ